MKNVFIAIAASSVLALSVPAAEVSTKISGVHLCCQSCAKGVQKAVEGSGATATASQDDSSITLTGPDQATVQKAADALVSAGYFGKSSDASIKLNANTGAKDQNVKSLDMQGVHLCCQKCVKAVNTALGGVKGATGNTAVKGAKTFTVHGDFNDKEAFDALQKAGLTGQVK